MRTLSIKAKRRVQFKRFVDSLGNITYIGQVERVLIKEGVSMARVVWRERNETALSMPFTTTEDMRDLVAF